MRSVDATDADRGDDSGFALCTAHSAGRDAGGFTLIELLVVIAVIALLVSMLMPSLRRAKDLAYEAACMSQTRHLGVAAQMYANDWDERFVESGWCTRDSRRPRDPETGLPPPNWLYQYVPDRYGPAGWKPDQAATGQLWPYVGSEGMYRCPAAGKSRGAVHNLTSYICNAGLTNWTDWWHFRRWPLFLRELRSPTDIWLVEQGTEAWAGVNPSWNDPANGPNQPISIAHPNGGAVISFDGHTELMSRSEYANELLNRPGRLYYMPYSSSGGYTGSYPRY